MLPYTVNLNSFLCYKVYPLHTGAAVDSPPEGQRKYLYFHKGLLRLAQPSLSSAALRAKLLPHEEQIWKTGHHKPRNICDLVIGTHQTTSPTLDEMR